MTAQLDWKQRRIRKVALLVPPADNLPTIIDPIQVTTTLNTSKGVLKVLVKSLFVGPCLSRRSSSGPSPVRPSSEDLPFA